MKKAFNDMIMARAHREKCVFLTGDLGFNAFEPLQEKMGPRFINAGVAEQNMVSVAAGLAYNKMEVWAYSIAPFIYARAFEQIRNDLCLHNLPVTLVGNGGGYAYGALGATHHAVEDYGILQTLKGLKIFIPAFKEDLVGISGNLINHSGPRYLRLGRCERPASLNLPSYQPWRQLIKGQQGLLLVCGPIAGSYCNKLLELDEQNRPSLWVVSELPIIDSDLPNELIEEISHSHSLCVVEEHVEQGSVGQALLARLAVRGIIVSKWKHYCVSDQFCELYGNQSYHREAARIDANYVIKDVLSL